MESPGRVLDELTYAYTVDSIYSILEKPQPVVEAEFRLVDQLIDPSAIVGGPNGRMLSVQYSKALNLVVPKVGALSQFNQDRQTVRDWLLEEIDTVIQGETVKMPRIQIYRTLNGIYLQAKSDWEKWKTGQLEAAMAADNPTQQLEKYTRELANLAPVREAELDSLFSDVVVRGYYHEVRTFLSMMDVASLAESLEETKEHMRNSSMSSLDETETIFPVQLQPTDWFKALSTDFQPQDLLLSPGYLQQQVVTLAAKLDELTNNRALLVAGKEGDPATLQQEVDAKQKEYDDAQAQMIKNFANATIAAAQIAIQVAAAAETGGATTVPGMLDSMKGGVSEEDATSLNTEKATAGNPDPLSKEQWQQIAEMWSASIDAQTELNSASRQLASLQAAHAAAESTNSKEALLIIDGQIQQVSTQLQNLKAITSSEPASGTGILPDSMPPAGRWFDVTASFQGSLVDEKSALSQSSEHTSWSVDLILGSASGSSDEQDSSFSSEVQKSATKVEIGFRATKVTIDRGGWFDPDVFGATASMYRVETGNPISPGPPPAQPKADQGKKVQILTPGQLSAFQTSFLPAYPVAFIIAKDVTIRVTLSADISNEAKDYMQKNSSVGGGFLCFSASHASSETKQSQAYFSSTDNKAIIIKIPGPQILGWIMEYVPKDVIEEYKAMPADALPKDRQAQGFTAFSIASPATNSVRNTQSPGSNLLSARPAVSQLESNLAVGRAGGPSLPFPFDLRGSKKVLQWRELTDNQWSNMLPVGWVDKGFHFYSRIKERGPAQGISSPADLELEINKGTVSLIGGDRYEIVLPIVNDAGKHFRILYDYPPGSKACQLVSATF